MDNPLLRDYIGDLWEVLPESGYVPRQDENWMRVQTDEMREAAMGLTMTAVQDGATESDAAAAVWAQIYRDTGHPRVYVREVPHEHSSGQSWTRGPMGVYELIGWAGLGIGDIVGPGGMYKALVRPSARAYQELAEAAERDLEAQQAVHETAEIVGDEDAGRTERIEQLYRQMDYNRRAAAVALQADHELWCDEMTHRLAQEG